MSEIHAAGDFTGKIVGTAFEQDNNEPDGLVLCFDLVLEDGHECTAKHRTHGQYAHICKNIITALGLEWPKGVLKIDSLVGQAVPVRIKHKASQRGGTFENVYINLGGGNAPASPDFVQAAIDKMAGGNDDIPF